jgi:hypothetical protein
LHVAVVVVVTDVEVVVTDVVVVVDTVMVVVDTVVVEVVSMQELQSAGHLLCIVTLTSPRFSQKPSNSGTQSVGSGKPLHTPVVVVVVTVLVGVTYGVIMAVVVGVVSTQLPQVNGHEALKDAPTNTFLHCSSLPVQIGGSDFPLQPVVVVVVDVSVVVVVELTVVVVVELVIDVTVVEETVVVVEVVKVVVVVVEAVVVVVWHISIFHIVTIAMMSDVRAAKTRAYMVYAQYYYAIG